MKTCKIADNVLEKYYKNELPPTENLEVEKYLFEQRLFECEQHRSVKTLLGEHLANHLTNHLVINQSDLEMPISEAAHPNPMLQKRAQAAVPMQVTKAPTVPRLQMLRFQIKFCRVAAVLILPLFFLTPTYIYEYFQNHWSGLKKADANVRVALTGRVENPVLSLQTPSKSEQTIPSSQTQHKRMAHAQKKLKPKSVSRKTDIENVEDVSTTSVEAYTVHDTKESLIIATPAEPFGVLAGKEAPFLTTKMIELQIKQQVDSLLLKALFLDTATSNDALKTTRTAFNNALQGFKEGKSSFEEADFFESIQDFKILAETVEDKYILALCYAKNDLYDLASELLGDILTKPLPSLIEKKAVEALLKLLL
jgi:hypothetical protein